MIETEMGLIKQLTRIADAIEKQVELNAIIHNQREKLRELNETRDILRKDKRILESSLDRAKRALCEVSQLSLQDNVDISRFYDIAHYTLTELNKELK